MKKPRTCAQCRALRFSDSFFSCDLGYPQNEKPPTAYDPRLGKFPTKKPAGACPKPRTNLELASAPVKGLRQQ